jgi:hypothetical protein
MCCLQARAENNEEKIAKLENPASFLLDLIKEKNLEVMSMQHCCVNAKYG